MTLDLAELFADAPQAEAQKVSGKWFPIRLTPDLATGELLNIGVGFIDNRRQLHVRILDSAKAFKCMYGPAGVENFSFLLTAVREHFQQSKRPTSPSHHVIIGDKHFASGDSAQDIVDALYESQVTLARNPCTDEDAAPQAKTVDNQSLRKTVFEEARKRHPKSFDRLFQKDLVTLRDDAGQQHRIDLPLYADGDMARNGARYGTFVSSHFRDPAYRGHNLNSGTVAMWGANTILGTRPNTLGGLFIYRPAEGAPGYDAETMLKIDNDIDNITWPFLRKKNMTVEVSNDPARLAEAALALAY